MADYRHKCKELAIENCRLQEKVAELKAEFEGRFISQPCAYISDIRNFTHWLPLPDAPQ